MRADRTGQVLAIAAALTLGAGAAPAVAQAVTAASLKGRTIEARVQYENRVRRSGREFTSPLTIDFKLMIGADNKVTGSITRSSFSPRGPLSQTQQIATTLGQPRQVRGSGHSLMLLAGNTLTILRTFDVGGWKTTITFTGSGQCTVRAPNMREVGQGATTRRDGLGGIPTEVLGSRQVSSSCQLR